MKINLLFFFLSICGLTSAQNITANFTSDTVCLGDTTCFHDLSTSSNGTIVAWNWNFGDPSGINVSNLQNPCHRYSSAGAYTVTLTVTNSNSNQNTITHQIIINVLPIAAFLTSTVGDTTFFQAYWQTLGCSFFWDFGDSYTSTLQNPYHIYSTNGTYTVCFTVTTCNQGCQTTACQQANVTTGVINETRSSIINIFPNPFSTETTLQADNLFKNATLTIYNLYGQTVKQIDNLSGQTVTFYRDNLPSGLYFLRLTQDSKVIATDKLVITDN